MPIKNIQKGEEVKKKEGKGRKMERKKEKKNTQRAVFDRRARARAILRILFTLSLLLFF